MSTRKPLEMIRAQPASDGAGVKLLRVFGGARPERFDPFLMLDEFGSNEASDYIGGFPPHPHRGFETITYMLCGKMEHRDHMGNVGLLNDGDVQWMTAGSGIIHSEMPRQTEGQMRGFQVWLNLSAQNKMKPAHYEDVAGNKLPRYKVGRSELTAIAGDLDLNGQQITGYFQRPDTLPIYWDVHLAAGDSLPIPVPTGYTAMLYAYDGSTQINDTLLPAQHLLRLGDQGEAVVSNPGEVEVRFILLAGKPLRQPIVQYGPFVMNTSAEIEQALADYRSGNFGRT